MADAKAIFVDGASLWNMMRINGVGRFNVQELYAILTKEVGESSQCFGRPVYVTKKTGSLAKVATGAGFEVLIFESYGAQDDKEIIRRIMRLTPEDVSEMTLVSADQDFIECLHQKMQVGIRVNVVATKKAGDGDRPMLGGAFQELFSEGAHFVELAEYKDRLMLAPFEDRRMVEKRKERFARKVTVSMHFLVANEDVSALSRELAKVITKYSNSKMIWKVEKE